MNEKYVLYGVGVLFLVIGLTAALKPAELFKWLAGRELDSYRDDPRMLGIVRLMGWGGVGLTAVFMLVISRINL